MTGPKLRILLTKFLALSFICGGSGNSGIGLKNLERLDISLAQMHFEPG